MKAIILAGGNGTRLSPMTGVISKQLLPIYDKPLIYYPLSTLIASGFNEILIICTPFDIDRFKKLFGDGEKLGIKILYIIQDNPVGLAHAFILAEEFIANEKVAMILGDNIFYGNGLSDLIYNAYHHNHGATIFAYEVIDAKRYGVIEFDVSKNVVSIEEKPKNPKSNWAVTGLYIYDKNVSKMAKSLKPSMRNELEITDLNQLYLKANLLQVEFLGRYYAWLDAGTPDSMLEASSFVQTIYKRQGHKIGCPEEAAFNRGFISEQQLINLSHEYGENDYGNYLSGLLKF